MLQTIYMNTYTYIYTYIFIHIGITTNRFTEIKILNILKRTLFHHNFMSELLNLTYIKCDSTRTAVNWFLLIPLELLSVLLDLKNWFCRNRFDSNNKIILETYTYMSTMTSYKYFLCFIWKDSTSWRNVRLHV